MGESNEERPGRGPTIARARRFLHWALRAFEAGEFEDLEPVPYPAAPDAEPGVTVFPGADFLPGRLGELHGKLISIEWHEPFDWMELADLSQQLDDDPFEAAQLGGRTVCQLLVAHGRAERFCDGALLATTRSGQLRALLARLNVLSQGLRGPLELLHRVDDVPPRRCKRRPLRCTACFTRSIAEILYGFPAHDEEMERDIAEGRLVLGGCLIGMDDPAWQCTTCGAAIHRPFRPDLEFF